MSNDFFNTVKVATEEVCHARWSCGKDGIYFRCAFCGHKIQPREQYLLLYTNDLPGGWGNPIVCGMCIGPLPVDNARLTTLREAWVRKHDDAKTKFWWFTKDLQ